MNENRRKNYFIKKKFQSEYFIKFIWLVFLEAVMISALFMFIARGTLTAAYSAAGLTIQNTGQYFFMMVLLITVIVAIGIGAAGIFIFIFLTHRVAGASYRFEKVLEAVIDGDLTQRVKLRKTDHLQELKDVLNRLLDKYEEGKK